ncbi:MAG: prolipoprotein diacylglyceryl transferase family protein [Gemmatimonadota bacterium]
MIPFVTQPSLSLGFITIHAFGLIVAISAFTGDWLYRRRLASLQLDPQVGAALGWWALTFGFVGAHLFSLVFYFPEKLARQPWLVFKLWEDVSSFGGMLGGALGALLFLLMRARTIGVRARWAYLDAAAFVLPFAWAIGRIACALAHDHPGGVTSFPLAISLRSDAAQRFILGVYADAGRRLPTGLPLTDFGFHDLGWYECLYLFLLVAPLFVWLNRYRQQLTATPGFWLAAFALVYAPMRIGLDTLRLADARYGGFAPGQYAAVSLLIGGLVAWFFGRRIDARSASQSLKALQPHADNANNITPSE